MNFKALVRPALYDATPYHPGKPIDEAKRELGLKRVVKLASNENFFGPSPKAIAALKGKARGMHIYPEGASPLLRRALAFACEVNESQVIIGNGSDEILRLLCEATLSGGDEVVCSQFAFIRFKQQSAMMGAKVIEVPMVEWKHDLEGMARAATSKTKLVFIASPNNPTGTHTTDRELRKFLKGLSPDILVVLDEAYYHYAAPLDDYPQTVPGLLRKHPNLFVVRTFSKAYGLAGLRIGFGIGSAEMIEWLDRIRKPFNVNLMAQYAALAALKDVEFVKKCVATTAQYRDALAEGLGRLGLSCVPSAGNFLFVHSPIPGRELFDLLLRQGVIVRPLDGYGLLNHVRISVGTAAENRFLLNALQKALTPVRGGAEPRTQANPEKGWIIAIDGPAGVGKSTVGSLVAKKLGYRFINTGEMYRALTWKALEDSVDFNDGKAVTALAHRLKWAFKTNDDGVIIRTYIDGQGVTQRIRDERVSRYSSIVAGVPGVRKHLRNLQRKLGRHGKIVMEGRDITTNVFPNADYKIYLDGSIDERAMRRTKQLRTNGKKVRLETVKKAILERDMGDLKRRINPLRQAKDAIVIDSTDLNMHEVADRILQVIHLREARGAKS